MLRPKKLKYNKKRKGRIKGLEYKTNKLSYGKYGLKALENGKISEYQIESSRKAIRRSLRRLGTLWIRIFPDTSITEKPIQVRMGKGKGAIKYWIAKVKPGTILFELDYISQELAYEALKRGSIKLPIKTKLVLKINDYTRN